VRRHLLDVLDHAPRVVAPLAKEGHILSGQTVNRYNAEPAAVLEAERAASTFDFQQPTDYRPIDDEAIPEGY
jgi:hypothetical protein